MMPKSQGLIWWMVPACCSMRRGPEGALELAPALVAASSRARRVAKLRSFMAACENTHREHTWLTVYQRWCNAATELCDRLPADSSRSFAL